MNAITLVGTLAAIFSTTSFAPQAWKIIRSRDTSAISTGMYATTVIGFALWLAYGLLKQEWPLILPNALCLLMSAFILLMKILPASKRDAVAGAIDPTADA